jgi:hypothetical protein
MTVIRHYTLIIISNHQKIHHNPNTTIPTMLPIFDSVGVLSVPFIIQSNLNVGSIATVATLL